MSSTRAIIGEVVRALAVLALVFLSFAPIAGDGGAAGITATTRVRLLRHAAGQSGSITHPAMPAGQIP